MHLLSMNLTEEFLSQSRQDAKKRRPRSFVSLRLCVSLPSDSQWFMVPMLANFGVGAFDDLSGSNRVGRASPWLRLECPDSRLRRRGGE